MFPRQRQTIGLITTLLGMMVMVLAGMLEVNGLTVLLCCIGGIISCAGCVCTWQWKIDRRLFSAKPDSKELFDKYIKSANDPLLESVYDLIQSERQKGGSDILLALKVTEILLKFQAWLIKEYHPNVTIQ